jgi:hypothetical protein
MSGMLRPHVSSVAEKRKRSAERLGARALDAASEDDAVTCPTRANQFDFPDVASLTQAFRRANRVCAKTRIS